MANLIGGIQEAAMATSPREFDLPCPTTLEEIMEKLSAPRGGVSDALPDQGRRSRAAYRL